MDEGELFKIREHFKTEEERKQVAANCFCEIFDGELLEMKKESEEKAAQALRVTSMFRLISPSYYFSKTNNW